MLAILSNFSDFLNNPVDQVFFLSIVFVIVLLIILLIASKIISMKKAKGYLKEIEAIKQDASNQKSNEEENASDSIQDEDASASVASINDEIEEEKVEEVEESEKTEEGATPEPIESKGEQDVVVEEQEKEDIAQDEPEQNEEKNSILVEEEPNASDVQEEAKEVEVSDTTPEVEEPNASDVQEEAKEVEVSDATPEVEETNEVQAKAQEEASQEVIEEPVKEKKGRSYNGKYEVYQAGDGYAYCLKASNGEQLVVSETFKSRDGVLKAIDAVKRNLENGDVKIFADKRGKFKFKLISKNYRVLALSSNYSTEKSAERAVESFKKFALKADIVDIEVEDVDAKTATIIEVSRDEFKLGGKFCIEKFNGEFSWDLKASNGQILCQAEGYTSKAGCLYSIDTFKKNVEVGTFKCVKDKSNRYCYKLYSTAGRIIAVGESYPSKQSAESAANSVCAFYKYAEIVEEK